MTFTCWELCGTQRVCFRFSFMVTQTVILYEHVFNMGREVELIWRSKWSLMKALYILLRYFTLITICYSFYGLFSRNPSNMVSLVYVRWEVFAVYFCSFLAESILQIRMYALYSQNKVAVVFMLVLYVATTIVAGWSAGSNMRLVTSFAVPIPGGSTCTPSVLAWYTYGLSITPLVYETLLCILILIRAYQTFTAESRPQHRGKVLLQILIRDSVLYYFILAFTYMTCLIVAG
ncbi:hypothetical protein CPC08DRAFT_277812 [Agrocybe pediades]|nr:hypothetical protein CPC08DRAFT_277812 [Agrocybe pediades]